MTDLERLRRQFEQAAGQAAGETDAALQGALQRLMSTNATDLKRLAPQVSDRATYDKLIAIVDEASARNLAIGEIADKVKRLGQAGTDLVKELAARIPV
jgi:hypothetical protein